MARASGEAARIVLLDGCLVYAYPPSPCEVYEAIAAGVTVVGAASLGALRAVELRAHGMAGCGWVYERYLDRTCVADDEVVTPMRDGTHAPLAVALVRVRYTLSCLVSAGAVAAPAARAVLTALRELYFEARTAEAVRAIALGCGSPPQIAGCLVSDAYDIKRHDALACLRGVAVADASALKEGSAR